MDDKVTIIWIKDGGVVPHLGRMVEGEKRENVPNKIAADLIKKGWAILEDNFEQDAEDC